MFSYLFPGSIEPKQSSTNMESFPDLPASCEESECESDAVEGYEGGTEAVEDSKNGSDGVQTVKASEGSENGSDTEVGAESAHIPREYPNPPSFLTVNGHPIDKTSKIILHMYMNSISSGILVGASIGSVIGTVVGFAVSTLSVPFVLLYAGVENAIDACKRKKD